MFSAIQTIWYHWYFYSAFWCSFLSRWEIFWYIVYSYNVVIILFRKEQTRISWFTTDICFTGIFVCVIDTIISSPIRRCKASIVLSNVEYSICQKLMWIMYTVCHICRILGVTYNYLQYYVCYIFQNC